MNYLLIVIGIALIAYDLWRWWKRRSAPAPVTPVEAAEGEGGPFVIVRNIAFLIFGIVLIILGWAVTIPEGVHP